LKFIYEQENKNWFIHSVIQRDWGFELETTYATKTNVRCITYQSLPTAAEALLLDKNDPAPLLAAAREYFNFLWVNQLYSTDLWRPCLWIKLEATEHSWTFVGWHTVFANFKDYLRRRTMHFDKGLAVVAYEEINSDHILYDSLT
jgi:hypothetical protein